MKTNKTYQKFIEIATNKHGNKYDYSRVVYHDNETKVEIYCRTCEESFWQTPHSHKRGYGCNKCASVTRGKNRRDSLDDFRKKAIAVHGDRYGYDQVVYRNCASKVIIFCKKCNITFEQTPEGHISGRGCSRCVKKDRKSLAYVRSTVESRGISVPDQPWIGVNHRILFRCKCGYEWKTTLGSVMNTKHGCRRCSGLEKKSIEYVRNEVKDRGILVPDQEYVSVDTPILFTCVCGNSWRTSPNNVIKRGSGCPHCIESKGERLVASVLTDLELDFTRQQKAEGCKYKYHLKYDFYVPIMKTFIEFHGEQHYEFTKVFHRTERRFAEYKIRDKIKEEWARDNGYRLIVIPYWIKDAKNHLLNCLYLP